MHKPDFRMWATDLLVWVEHRSTDCLKREELAQALEQSYIHGKMCGHREEFEKWRGGSNL